MATQRVQAWAAAAWALAASQHGVLARAQLLALGMSAEAIKHRVRTGRLHPILPGVYAVGRRELSRHGRWMAAILFCRRGAVLSHESAGQLLGIRPLAPGPIEVSIPATRRAAATGLSVHRRTQLCANDTVRFHGIPVTSPLLTLIDLAKRLSLPELERAINEADRLDLIDPDTLRGRLDDHTRQPGVAPLRRLLDRRTFLLTDSELERLFLPIARRAGLPPPLTRRRLNGFRVDFWWPDLGLVVETDGLRYHRTPAQQARDRIRDQTHLAAGLTPVRFTHAQVRWEGDHVEATLRAVVRRLGRGAPRSLRGA